MGLLWWGVIEGLVSVHFSPFLGKAGSREAEEEFAR